MEGEGEDKTSSEAEWSVEDSLALNECLLGQDKDEPLILAGLNKHFNMVILLNRIYKLTNKKMDRKVVWDRIHYLFDIEKLDKLTPCPFPNEPCEFSLPEKEFGQLMQEKRLEGESKDSESGRETPPTLPMARRGTSQSGSGSVSNKRKSSASESVTVTESGRRSTTATPVSSPAKPKRRI